MATKPKAASLADRAALHANYLSELLDKPETVNNISALNVMRIEAVVAACRERGVDRTILGFNEKLDKPAAEGGFTDFYKEVWCLLGPAQQRGLRKLFYDTFNQIV